MLAFCIQDSASQMRRTDIEWRSRIRLVDEVADVLRSGIYAGHFPLGTRLRQQQLAVELNVSRTPLREALRILEREGLVQVQPGRSVRVISADLSLLLDAYAVREVIDGLAARLVAAQDGDAVLARLERALVEQAQALDPWDASRYTETNVRFHSAVITAAGNKFLNAQLPLVHMTSQVFIPIARLTAERAERALEEHRQILAAIRAGDPETAEGFARAHVLQTSRSLARSVTDDRVGSPDARPL
jgi:DNA-binding GntR family transcriptional regulator